MNYMMQVANLLGVELYEEFKIEGYSGNVKYRLTEENLEYLSSCGHWISISSTLNNLLNGEHKVAKMPILDDVEKEFLSAVIKPFRNRIEYVCKYKINDDYERLYIKVSDDESDDERVIFPQFERGTMYKGMKPGRKYSLGDLSL